MEGGGDGSGGEGDQDQQGKGSGKDNKGKQRVMQVPGQDKLGKLDSHKEWEEGNKPNLQTLEGLREITEEAKQEVERNKGRSPYSSRSYGSMPGFARVELAKCDKQHNVPWNKLLRNRLASIRLPGDLENWARCHRKMYQYYPDIVLPGPHENQVNASRVFVALDTSGSIADETIAELVNVIKTLPEDQYQITYAWFDTELYKVEDFEHPVGRGGTSFQAIENVVKGKSKIWQEDYGYSTPRNMRQGEEVELYPDIVIVLTDGEAATPDLEHPSRWIFVLTEDGTDHYLNHISELTMWRL
jgi:predicted metal-dependent peptidase